MLGMLEKHQQSTVKIHHGTCRAKSGNDANNLDGGEYFGGGSASAWVYISKD